MTNQERAAMQQALEALEDLIVYSWNDGKNGEPDKAEDYAGVEAIIALREALANTRSNVRSTSEYSEQPTVDECLTVQEQLVSQGPVINEREKIIRFLGKKEDEYEARGNEQWALCASLLRAEIMEMK